MAVRRVLLHSLSLRLSNFNALMIYSSATRSLKLLLDRLTINSNYRDIELLDLLFEKGVESHHMLGARSIDQHLYREPVEPDIRLSKDDKSTPNPSLTRSNKIVKAILKVLHLLLLSMT